MICEVFPSEVPSVYYESPRSKNPTGKLFDAFKNLRSQLLVCGLATATKSKGKTGSSSMHHIPELGK